MKAEELRIGNWVTWEGEACKLDGITRDFNDSPYDVEIEFSNGLFNREPIEDLKPIPLSEEWLIRFGFLLEDFNWYKNDSDDSFYISFESDYGFYVGATTYGYLKAILYVHQLQNLYFALTGKELTIEK